MGPRRLALAGPMGAGKSSVGRLLAARWGVPFVDLDSLLGDIPAVFATEGEAGFRARERAALARAAQGHGVLALGGGTLVDATNREQLHDWRIVVLMAGTPTLRARIGDGRGRPLAAELGRLLAARAETWRLSGPWVDTEGLGPAAVADRVEAVCGSP